MKRVLFFACWALFFELHFAPAAPVDASARASVTTAATRSTMDRTSGLVTSSVDVSIRNSGDRTLESPLHAAIFFTADAGTLNGLQVIGANGGLGQPPYQTFFYDLSGNVGAGLLPQATTTFSLRFTPPKGTRVTFRIVPFAIVNGDPIPNAGGPYGGQRNDEIAFDAAGSSDPDNDPITFAWDFGDGSPVAAQASPRHRYALPGAYEALLTVRDNRGGAATVRVPVGIKPAQPFAVARVRTLDGAGLPLGGVDIAESLSGAIVTFKSQRSSGFSALGRGAGAYVWKFSKPGFLDVWRKATLSTGSIAIVANPWLAVRNANAIRISPIAGARLTSPAVAIDFAAGAFPQPSDATLTELTTQTLPFPLPAGWNPLAQFDLALSAEPAQPGLATVQLRGAVASGEPAFLAKLNPVTVKWETVAIINGSGTNSLTTQLASSGAFVFAVRDLGATAPPLTEVGQPLEPTTAGADTSGVTATGSVTPPVAAASRDAALVTATARVVFENSTPLPGGTLFSTAVTEKYELAAGGTTRTPDYETTVFAFQRPGNALAAEFPMRPQLLFGPEELKEATVHVEVLNARGFGGGVIDNSGGQLAKDGVHVTVPPDAVAGVQPAEMEPRDPQSFVGLLAGVVPVKAFTLNLGTLTAGTFLGLTVDGLEANAHFVLGIVVTDGNARGVTPLERFTTDVGGRLTSAEPATGPRLPGANGSGDYVLIKTAGPLALIEGIARDASGNPVAGLAVRAKEQPWLVFSGEDGSYKILSGAGATVVTVTDPRDGNEGSTNVAIDDPAQSKHADLSTAPTPPRVATVDPAVNATGVRRVTPITITFSEPITGASFGGNGVILRDASNNVVPAALTLNRAGTIATLLPANPLDAGTRFQIEVSGSIQDTTGLALAGEHTFIFTTAADVPRPVGAQLIIYEPGAANVPAEALIGYNPATDKDVVVVQGTSGVADPRVAVILVNETTAETATVLSKADGSFVSHIRGSEEDLITATFISANGTRVSVPVQKQMFDDGRVGLYRAGGILEAQSDGGPVQVQIQPEAIKSRNVFKVESLGLPELLGFLNNTLPQNAQLIGGVKLTVEGEQVQGASEMSFPLDPSTLQMQPGTTPENGAFALSVARQVEGQTVYQVVDKLRYEDGRLFTNTAPFQGPLGNGVVSPEGLAATFGGAPGAIGSAVFSLIVMPLFLGDKPVTVTGQVAQLPESTVSQLEIAAIAELVLQFFTPFEVTAEDLALTFGAAKPVAGALVSFFQEGEGLAEHTALPGRIEPGLVCAISDRTGCYNLVLPGASAGGSLVGTHPRLGRTFTGISFVRFGVGTAGKLRRNIIFPTPDNEFFNTAPKLAVGHTPLYPAPGGTAKVDLRVISATTPTILPPIKQVFPLVEGVTVTPGDVTIGSPTTTNPAAHQTVWKADVTCTKAAIVVLKFTVSSQDNTEATSIEEVIEFGGVPPVADNPVDPADPDNDKEGPVVIGSYPLAGDTLPPGQPIIIEFSEPIDKAVLTDNAAISFDANLGTKPALILSPNQTTLTIVPGPLPSTDNITLTIGTSVKDLAGNQLDQHPAESGPQSYSLKLHVGQLAFTDITNVPAGGGVVIGGDHLFVLDRSGNGSLKVFKIGASQIFPPTEVALPGFPRDLVYIPNYSFSPGLASANTPITPPVTRDLLVVVGGNLGAKTTQERDTTATGGAGKEDVNITFLGQYLRVFDVTDPNNPVRIASARITLRESAITKLRWQAPTLAYLENGADAQFIGLIDLQELLIGFSLNKDQLAAVDDFLPADGKPGVDLNGDGDYVDTGEKVPLPPARPTEYFGFVGALEPTAGTTQRIEDFAFEGGLLGVTLSKEVAAGNGGQPLPPQYRTILTGSGEVPAEVGAFPYDNAARPKRVSILPSVNVAVAGVTQARAIALVSLSPDRDNISKLSVLDITDSTTPVELRRIRFDPDLQLGLLQSAIVRPDGLIALATTNDVVLLDPLQLAAANPPNGTLHPAIRGIFRGAGTGNISASESSSGLRAIALGGRNQLIQPPPEFRFVFFPLADEVVKDPGALKNDTALRDRLLAGMQVVNNVRPARFRGGSGAVPSIDPPSPAAHFHVLVRAPGAAGNSIPLALELLNEAGHPVDNKGAGFPPVRAADPATLGTIRQTAIAGVDAPIPTFKAFRLSQDPKSDEFNLYLSEPLAVVRERMTAGDLQRIENSFAKPRAVLWSENMIRVSIDNSGASQAVIAAFASETDGADRVLRPKASGVAFTLPGGYILGPNPPPMGGELAIPGTFQLVDAASGEFRYSTVDMALPSRRMPIRFERTVNNQDTCYSAFGNGWDFFYNQRLIELRADTFLPGNVSPSIVRKDMPSSVIAGSSDVEFRDGAGRTIVFKKQDGVPQAFSSDPLVQTLEWPVDSGTCYLPHENEKGVFDLLFRFPGGEFVRLTPEGTQFWYQRNGRLSRIVDRFPKNYHVLEYSERGELRRIIDRSVDSDRFLEIGYYRGSGATDLIPQLDEVAQNDAEVGKIARLRDYARMGNPDTSVRFFYSQKGLLEARQGIAVAGANGGFSGRATTRYLHDSVTGAVTGVVTGNGANSGGGAGGGTALLSTTTATSASGALVANSGNAVGSSPVTISVPVANSAAGAGSQTSNSGAADGGASEMKFDDFRYPQSIKMTGPMAGPATYKPHFNPAGLLESVVYPENNSTEYTYNLNNPVLRARPNITHITKKPSTRGGNPLNADFHYDERYNLMSGAQTDFNGKTNTYTLRGDGREIDSIAYDGGGTQKFKHDDDTGELKEETSPEGVKVGYAYESPTGFLLTITRGSLAPTTYSYGADVPAKLGRPNAITPPRGDAWTGIQYDALLQMTERSRGGMTEKRGYDENGNLAFLSRTLGDGRTYSEDRVYGQNNFLQMVTVHGVEVNGMAIDLVTKFDPDPLFRVAKITYPDMKTRTFTYDHLGNVVSMTVGAYTEGYTRDLHGNLLELRTNGDLVRTMTYNGHDRLILTTNKTGTTDETIEMDYFPGGQVSKTTAKSGSSTDFERTVSGIDGLGRPLGDAVTGTNSSRTITYQANAQGLTTTIVGPRDTTIIKTDSAGRYIGLKNGAMDVTLQPDDNDNVEHIISNEGGSNVYKQDFVFDGLDHATMHSDGVGTRATFTPRFDGLATSVTDDLQHATTFDYSTLGETLSRTRPEQIAFTYQFDENRLPQAVLDPQMAGNHMEYDATFRRSKLFYRSGALLEYTHFDNRNQPTDGTIPGGNFAGATYDLQGRLLSQKQNYSVGDNYEVKDRKFDSLGRTHSIGYGKSAQHSATFGYDELGPLTSADYNEPGGPFHVGADIYEDGSRKTTTYPSGTTVEDGRENNSRLHTVTVDGVLVWDTTSFEGAELPGRTNRGALREINTYDARKRLLSRRFEKVSGALVEEMRFTYDAVNNLSARQFLGRGGRGDVFEYDDANRMTRAEIGARPSIAGTVRVSAGLTGGSGLSPGFFARAYGYDSGGLDLLMSATPSNPSNLPPQAQPGNSPGPVVPEFMQSLDGQTNNGYLHATLLDGANRGGTDAMGNVQSTTLVVRAVGAAEPEKVKAINIKYNGLNHLTVVTLATGVTIEYEYQPTGLVHHKTVSQGGVTLLDHAFVWDRGRLIEERDIASGSTVVGRYYYADGDAPIAADLTDPSSGQVRHVQYLCDNVWSVVAVADQATGDVLERVSYDAWGQPLIEKRDIAAPHVAKVHADPNGDLLFHFSEPILPAVLSGGGTGIVASAQPLAGLITITAGANPLNGTIEYFEDAPGAPFGSVIRFRPGTATSGSASVQIAGAKVFDSWGNPNPGESMQFALGVVGDVFLTSGVIDTSPPRVARSAIGNSFLFHGQYFDYDSGLSYMRARFYDPYTGQFLQRDPMQYADSVNLYAALGSNPASVRDPTGTINLGDLEEIAKDAAKIAGRRGREVRLAGSKALRAAVRAAQRARLSQLVGPLARGAENVEQIPRGELDQAIKELEAGEEAFQKVAKEIEGLPPELQKKLNIEQVLRVGTTLRRLSDEGKNVDSIVHDINTMGGQDVRVLSQEEAATLDLQNPHTSETKGFYAGNPGRGFIDKQGRRFVGIHDVLTNQVRKGEKVPLTFLDDGLGNLTPITHGPAAEKLRRELVHEIASDLVGKAGLKKTNMYVGALEEILHKLSKP